MLPGTELKPVSSNKHQQNEEAFSRNLYGAGMFPQCFLSVSSMFRCQVLFSRCRLFLRYTAGKFNENPSMRALAKILRALASEHSSSTLNARYIFTPLSLFIFIPLFFNLITMTWSHRNVVHFLYR